MKRKIPWIYIYEKDYICYKEGDKPSPGDGNYIYYSSSGIYKYTETEEYCLKAAYSYLEDKNCVKKCSSEHNYKKLP